MSDNRRRFSDEQLAECAEREAKMRREKYPRMEGGMTPFRSQQTAMMEEIARILREKCNEQPDMIGGGR